MVPPYHVTPHSLVFETDRHVNITDFLFYITVADTDDYLRIIEENDMPYELAL